MCPILTKAEGLITGMAAKMFLIAGPVIVFGTAASVVYGVVLWLLGDKCRQGVPLAVRPLLIPGSASAAGPAPGPGHRRK